MSFLYRQIVRPLLFAQDSERIHDRTLQALAYASRNKWLCNLLGFFWCSPSLPVELFGLSFPNPLGLAAGMDKKAMAVPVWETLGFGFCELGGVTWHAQTGNPAPRMFRAVSDAALINRMGFNNPGAEVMAQTLRKWRSIGHWPQHPVGINLGKSKITPLERAAEDYARSFQILRNLADFFVVNVSSPNTPGLRQLQDKAALGEILASLQQAQHSSVDTGELRPRHREGGDVPGTASLRQGHKPILVKVAPDLSYQALDEIVELAESRDVAGIVATNTTISRPATGDADSQRIYAESGGLSGKPIRERSTEVIRHLYRQTKGRLPIVGVGGIFTAEDAWDKITSGASLIQLYTGLVYEGPGLARQIVTGIGEKLRSQGFVNLRQAVGSKA